MVGMESRFQISLKGMLWAMAWIGIWLATLRFFELPNLFDDGPDSLAPRMIATFWAVPLCGLVGALRGQPIALAKKAFLFWLPVAWVIALITPAIY
jgi:hypothetical protein